MKWSGTVSPPLPGRTSAFKRASHGPAAVTKANGGSEPLSIKWNNRATKGQIKWGRQKEPTT